LIALVLFAPHLALFGGARRRAQGWLIGRGARSQGIAGALMAACLAGDHHGVVLSRGPKLHRAIGIWAMMNGPRGRLRRAVRGGDRRKR